MMLFPQYDWMSYILPVNVYSMARKCFVVCPIKIQARIKGAWEVTGGEVLGRPGLKILDFTLPRASILGICQTTWGRAPQSSVPLIIVSLTYTLIRATFPSPCKYFQPGHATPLVKAHNVGSYAIIKFLYHDHWNFELERLEWQVRVSSPDPYSKTALHRAE